MPIFNSEFTDPKNDVIGYYDNQQLVAFSLLRRFDNENVEAVQFAWNYNNPNLSLGINSLKSECAIYKELGFKYLYLGGADEYKKKIDGFELLGPL
jgi:arginyl-tRNA--protein-N-Asp/Glu arginylyltransferase